MENLQPRAQVSRHRAVPGLLAGWSCQTPSGEKVQGKANQVKLATCTLDINQRTVTHHYEGESVPWGKSFEVATPFRFFADTLHIGGDTLTWLRFVRVR
jgi:hypothetical protein